MRRCREKQEVARVAAQRLGELVVLRLLDLATALVRGQVMSLVDHHEIVKVAGHSREVFAAFRRVD